MMLKVEIVPNNVDAADELEKKYKAYCNFFCIYKMMNFKNEIEEHIIT